MSEKNLVSTLLQCCHCLQSLRIVQVHLDGSWAQVIACLHYLRSLRDVSLHFLRVGPGASRPLGFSGLRDDIDVPDSLGQRLQLRRKGIPGNTRVVGVDYSGPGMGNVLAMLMNSIEE